MTTLHVPPGTGERYPMPDGDHIAKAAVLDANGGFEVFEIVAPAAPPTPAHSSPWSGVMYLLEGRLTVSVGGTSYDVEPGGVVVFPARTPSTFCVVGESARFLAITSGDGAGRFFADFAHSVRLDRPMEESMADIVAVTQRHEVELAGA